MERFIVGGAIGIFIYSICAFLDNHKLNSGDCYVSDRRYCVVKSVEDGFYNVECTYNIGYDAIFFGYRKRFYQIDLLETQACPKNIKEPV